MIRFFVKLSIVYFVIILNTYFVEGLFIVLCYDYYNNYKTLIIIRLKLNFNSATILIR